MSKGKRRLVIAALVLALANLLVVLTGNDHLYPTLENTLFKGRLGPAIDEYGVFENRIVKAGNYQAWPESDQYNNEIISPDLLNQIESYDPVALLVVRKDSIQYEQYWDGYNENSISNSFSMAKSFISILVGIAIGEGKIKSLDQPVGDFLLEFNIGKNKELTIRHLLEMSSGINFDENYINPFAFPARANYGDNLELLISEYEVTETPGKKWKYLSGNTQLLGFILRKATGETVSDYAAKKLWQPIGAKNDALWSLDQPEMHEKAFCCFNSNARDFARIGQLMLDKGNWKGKQIIPRDYVLQSITPTPLVHHDDGRPNNWFGYSWWLMKHREMKVHYARGILGQYIFVVPEKDLVVVRLGHKRGSRTPEMSVSDIPLYLDAALAIIEE